MDETKRLSDLAAAAQSTSRAPADQLPAIGSVINGRYHVKGFLGAGGMGSVYRVSDSALKDRPLALKILRGDRVRPDRLDLFKSEFRIMTGFHHPNVASVYDFERIHGSATDFFTMDYVEGRDIYVATEGADVEAVLDLVVQMCRALAYVHSRQLIHFDMKPSNVLVSSLGRVRVLDFGIAGTARQGARSTIGTPAYMAPELFDDGRADHRADLFSVGIILNQLLTRAPPATHLPGYAPIEIESGAPRVPAWLAPVIARLCATDPADRFRSANAVIEAINDAGGRRFEIGTPQTRQSYVLSSRFVGREQEMRQIMHAVTARTVRAGTAAPMLVISGPSGIGKSRLMREVRHRVQLSGVAFVEASCYEGSFSEYGPLTRAVADLLRLNEGLERSDPAQHPPREIHFEDASPNPTSGDTDSKREQLRIRDQAVEFLLAMARRVPYVLCLNDLHWAQPATVGILTQLAWRLRAADQAGSPLPVTVLVTFRDEDTAGRPFEPILRTLHDMKAADGAALAPLNVEEVTGLVGSMVGAAPPVEFAERLARETAGVPFFVEEVMRTLVEQGAVAVEDGAWASAGAVISVPVSAAMVNVLRQRAAVLGSGPRILLTAIAACARPASPVMLSAATGLDPEEFASGLRLLLQRRMVMLHPGESITYAVAHGRLREVIYGDLAPDQKRNVHESIARAIEHVWPGQIDAHVYELAHHYWLGHDRDKALVYSIRAAERARSTYANGVAIELFTRVMDLLQDREPVLKCEIAEKLGDLNALHGRFEDALARYREILPAFERTPHQARLFRKIANVHWQRGELGTGVDWLWRAVEALGDKRPSSRMTQIAAVAGAAGWHVLHQVRPSAAHFDIAERGRLLELSAIYLQLGEAYFFHDSSQMLLPILRASNAGERAGGDSRELCRACHAVVVLYGTLTWWRQAERYAHRLAEMAGRLHSDWHIGAAHTYWLILHYYRSQWRHGIERGRHGQELLARCGDVMELSFAYWVTALCYYYRGELHQAAGWTRQGLDAMARADSAQPAKGILVVSARVNARLGRAAEAREQIERSCALATEARDLFLLTWAQMMMGDCLLVAGQIEEAVVWLENARRQREANGLLPEFLIEVYPLLADARLEQLERQTQLTQWERRRRLGEIAAIARTAVRLSRRRRHYRAAALRTLAMCCWRQGKRRRAARLFEESMAVAEALGAPLQLADVLESWGRCLAGAGNPAGRARLERAREIFEEMGAVALAQRVSSTIMGLDQPESGRHSPHPRPGSAASGGTPRPMPR